MGVPAFFRWLCTRFPKIIIDVVENEDEIIDGVHVPTDTSKANPNNIEFDCLYLDMNGIIHPCTHPEDQSGPITEEQMMINIMNYVDRMFSIVRPRKLLYMAIDGVAPRAKMNQQRSRRFKSRKEAKEKAEKMKKDGVMEEEEPASNFDSNCITPGTEFMEKVSQYLKYYIALRQSSDPGWAGIKVILSDSNAPGEGEHKIMHYIRYQRSQPEYDPNMHHVICGLDADLIMLGLSTHEPHFTILREVVTVQNNNNCFICGQPGHLASECKGKPKDRDAPIKKKPFQFLHLSVLREYLDQWLFTENLEFEYDFERVIDDWVFLCFFVGNDFLPHLPTLEIRENALDLLTKIYKDVYPRVGYLTSNGELLLDRVEPLVSEIAKLEDQILINRLRKQTEKDERDKSRKRNNKSDLEIQNEQNMAAAVQLRSKLLNELGSEIEIPQASQETDKDEIVDHVRLGEEGWKDRYYTTKFHVEMNDQDFFTRLKQSYVEGLVWVYRYYYQGCASWKWFYPFHYAPFASEIIGLSNVKIDFALGTPITPLEQLMSVLPADSGAFLPPAYRSLMTSPDSPILDFYPTDFVIEPEKNKPAWTWVALLPFIDEQRLATAIQSVRNTLTSEEQSRDELRDDILSVHISSSLARVLSAVVTTNWIAIDPSTSPSFAGFVALLEDKFQTDVMQPPKHSSELQPLNHPTIMLKYKVEPLHTFPLKFGLLQGAIPPPRILSSQDFFNSARREHQNSAANRMINHSIQSGQHKIPHHVQERRQHQPHPYAGKGHRDKRDDHKQRDFRNYHQRYESGNKHNDQRNYQNRASETLPPPQFAMPQFNPIPQPMMMGPVPIPFGMPLPGTFPYPMYNPNMLPQTFPGNQQQNHNRGPQHPHQRDHHNPHNEQDSRKRKY